MKKYIAIFMCSLVIFSGCGTMSKTAGGTAIGAGSGAALGAIVGALISKDAKGAAIGAAIGTAVGAGTGAVIGKQMDKKAEELEALNNAKVETVTDANGLAAIKVTFESGILFKVNGADLSATSKKELKTFATKMADMKETNISVFGHTDSTGSAEVNERLSVKRAEAVANYLHSLGIDASRLEARGLSFTQPVASNETAEGRAQNRRVEIFITANDEMIKEAAAAAGEAK